MAAKKQPGPPMIAGINDGQAAQAETRSRTHSQKQSAVCGNGFRVYARQFSG